MSRRSRARRSSMALAAIRVRLLRAHQRLDRLHLRLGRACRWREGRSPPGPPGPRPPRAPSPWPPPSSPCRPSPRPRRTSSVGAAASRDAGRQGGGKRLVQLGHQRRGGHDAGHPRLDGRAERPAAPRPRRRAGEWVTTGSSRCESRSVSPWPGKCLAQAATPPPCKPADHGRAEAADEVGVVAERTVADDGVLRVGVHVHHGREVPADAARREARRRGPAPCARRRPRSRAGPTARSDGQSVQGSRSRATRPPSWSTPIMRGRSCPASRAMPCSSRTSSATCSGPSTFRANRMTWPTPYCWMRARTSAEGAMPSKPTITRCPARRQALLHPPRRFLTASLTRLPSAGFPAADRTARAAFMALPMSLTEAAPVSATACSTAAATSASLASCGQVRLEHGDLGGLLVHELLPRGLLELLDRVLALLHEALENAGRLGVVEGGLSCRSPCS